MPISSYSAYANDQTESYAFVIRVIFAKTFINISKNANCGKKEKQRKEVSNGGLCFSPQWEKQQADASLAIHHIQTECLPIVQFLKIDFH